MKKNCQLDKDCNNNEYCAFNENDMNHYCIKSSLNDSYVGCLDNNSGLDYIETKSNADRLNYKNCIEFTRRQKTPDELSYNYMVFKPKKPYFVDTGTINIYLKCDSEILAVIPYNDYFVLTCDDNQHNCILEGKDGLKNFINQNTKNCDRKVYLEVDYECENEKVKKILNIPVSNSKIIINLKCDKNDSICRAAYVEDLAKEKAISKSVSVAECANPLFNIPRIVPNTNIYKNINDKKTKEKINVYDEEINKLRTKRDALENNQDYWKTYKDYDAAQYLYNDSNTSETVLTYYGMVHSIEEATRAATENNQSFFVWYHNSYDLDNFSSKLYFINVNNISDELFNKENWGRHENVTTAILKMENFNDKDDADESEKDIELKKMLNTAWANTVLMKEQYEILVENSITGTDYNVNDSVIKNLDNKITTFSQAISMNNYETGVNNNILIGVGITLGLMLLIFIIVLVYFNRITAGKIVLFDYASKRG